jgi:hypothetical protein
MSFSDNIRNIKKLTAILTTKDADVVITYKGNGFGLTKCWNIRCDAREYNAETYEDAASLLIVELKKELKEKINFTNKQAAEYMKTLAAMDN